MTEILIYTVINTGTKHNFYIEITPSVLTDRGFNIKKPCENYEEIGVLLHAQVHIVSSIPFTMRVCEVGKKIH